ncbi:MAG: hypothetical protein TREMPRED_000142 [Tremellales sp. Tagirdzhanova-0007]|nr:MAG: hypothetical protein TREMPRED_000142 [Tremellales sp. Tagirdzhanova-0007]
MFGMLRNANQRLLRPSESSSKTNVHGKRHAYLIPTQTTLMVADSNTIEIPFPIPISRFPPWLNYLPGIIHHFSVLSQEDDAKTDAFKDFEVFALRLSRQNAVSIDQRIKDALPVLAEQLSGLLEGGRRIQLGDVKSRRGIAKDPLVNTYHPLHPDSGPPFALPVPAPVLVSIPSFSINLDTSSSANRSAHAIEETRSITAGPSSSGPSSNTLSAANPPAATTEQPRVSSPEHAFSMSRSVTTVVDLWTEYSVGLGGRPSVRFMYEQGGLPDWRAKYGDSERHFYGTRKNIWTFNENIAEP